MFRKYGVISAAALAVLGLAAPSATAATSATPTPVCLITTSLSKEMICAELMSRSAARGTFHSMSDATLTVTLEYSSTVSSSGSFAVLATKTVSGSGMLDVTTDPVAVPATGSVQACATATDLPSQRKFHLCASS
ncbi:MAG TPA: hypothetical protein VHX38_10595 [Pseudonocardiaceae bacterium]|jgi:hypothetical protein|nr:hypothetical protein [Pseudonocardiaceae bacterium]